MIRRMAALPAGTAFSDRVACRSENEKAARWAAILHNIQIRFIYRTIDVSELVNATGLPALMTWAVWV
jgi:hypothetical protein